MADKRTFEAAATLASFILRIRNYV